MVVSGSGIPVNNVGLLCPCRRGWRVILVATTLLEAETKVDKIYLPFTPTAPENQFPSTLVFEVSDSVRVRHIVSLSPAHANKLRRRLSHAKKLHIYNDHVFIATHLKQ